MKYCALLNNTFNIGDDLQSVAAMRFLPTIDYYAFKEKLSLFKCDDTEKPKIILNSWYMWKTKNFPPSSDLDPLLISMHFSEQCRKKILTHQTKEWMKKHGPVGCRDIDTQNWLLENGIDAYFSGCLTLTLTENPNLRNKNGFILCIDVSDKVVETIKKRTNKQVRVLSKNIFGAFSAKSRLEISKMFIYLYHQASVVVTGNMHTSLPSLAINTPVCLLTDENGGPDVAKRFSGLIDFFNHYTTKEFIENDVYDLNTPPPKPNDTFKFATFIGGKMQRFYRI